MRKVETQVVELFGLNAQHIVWRKAETPVTHFQGTGRGNPAVSAEWTKVFLM